MPPVQKSPTKSNGTQLEPQMAVTRFPKLTWKTGRPFYRFARARISGKETSPWWFCNKGDCRFDLSSTGGTLYGGSDEIVGILEYIGREMKGAVIGVEYLRQRILWCLRYDASFPLADLSSGRARSFGVTNELAAMQPYDVPQSWAAAFAHEGFEGIHYRSVHDTRDESRALAIFDEAGSHDWPTELIHDGGDQRIVAILADLNIKVQERPLQRDVILI
jgi:hypothetical protein